MTVSAVTRHAAGVAPARAGQPSDEVADPVTCERDGLVARGTPDGAIAPGTELTGVPGCGRVGTGRVLVVDDDATVAGVVADYLRSAGLEPRHAADGLSALSLAVEWEPDLVILDLMLPGIDGLEVCRRMRNERNGQVPLPVIILTALSDESERVLALETGADDYVTKPFSPRELTLRVQAVLRRAAAARCEVAVPPPPVRAGRFEVDGAARLIRKDSVELALTVREFGLLAFFITHPGRAFTRAELLEQVWGWSFGDLSNITVFVRRLREKVEDDPAVPVQLQTVWGVGYRWKAEPWVSAATTQSSARVPIANVTGLA